MTILTNSYLDGEKFPISREEDSNHYRCPHDCDVIDITVSGIQQHLKLHSQEDEDDSETSDRVGGSDGGSQDEDIEMDHTGGGGGNSGGGDAPVGGEG